MGRKQSQKGGLAGCSSGDRSSLWWKQSQRWVLAGEPARQPGLDRLHTVNVSGVARARLETQNRYREPSQGLSLWARLVSSHIEGCLPRGARSGVAGEIEAGEVDARAARAVTV